MEETTAFDVIFQQEAKIWMSEMETILTLEIVKEESQGEKLSDLVKKIVFQYCQNLILFVLWEGKGDGGEDQGP